MNRLKCMLGINVPRRIPSHTAVLIENHAGETCKKHSTEVHLRPLLKSARFSLRMRRFHDIRGFHYVGPARNEIQRVSPRNKSKDSILLKRIPLQRNSSLEYFQRRHGSTYLTRKPPDGKRHSMQSSYKLTEIAKNLRNSESNLLAEKEPRTYAQMIASYCDTLYTESSSGVLKDNLSSAIINGVRRSPFSTASVVSMKWKNKSKGCRNSGGPRFMGSSTLNQKAKFSSDTSTTLYRQRNEDRNLVGSVEEVKQSTSYATMIENYTNSLNVDANHYNWYSNLIPKRNVSTNRENTLMMLMDTNDNVNTTTEKRTKDKDIIDDITKTSEEPRKTQNQEWKAKVEDVIKDLKEITVEGAADIESMEKSMLQSVNEHAEWMDKVVDAYRNRIVNARHGLENTTENVEPQSMMNDATPNTIASLNENVASTTQSIQMSNKKSSTIADYLKRGVGSGSTTNISSQPPTNVVTESAKQPQIELRMTPSQNESMVSINVDELAAKTAGGGIKEHLSVVIASKKNETSRADASSSNIRSDFGSMQISISENTVPVKQIEFSINGKPVSELKSIIARADKLDVLSSLDRMEIRVPQKANVAVSRQATSTAKTPVLNLQIAAKFNQPRVQQPKDTGVRTTITNPGTQTPTPVPTSKPTPTQVPPAKPTRTQNLFSSKEATGNVKGNTDVPSVKSEDIAMIDPFSFSNSSVLIANKETPTVADKKLLNERSNIMLRKSNEDNSSTNSPDQPTMRDNPNTRNENDNRVPSNIIPWWSSEDAFRKIRKKGNTQKNTSAIDDAPRILEQSESDVRTINCATIQKTETLSKSLTPKKPMPKGNKSLINVKPTDVINFQKSGTPMVDQIVAKPLSEGNKSLHITKPTFHAARVRSSRKRAAIKRARRKNIGRMVKSSKYRARKLKTFIDKQSAKPMFVVRTPKSVKYVSVNPQRVFVNEESKAKVSLTNAKDNERRNGSIAESTKYEEASKIKKMTENSKEADKIDAVLKPIRDLKKPANRSADLSAKSSAARMRRKQQDTRDELVRGNVSGGREPTKRKPDPRIKEILKSMKPIEKRKDGILIDYGVVVPSRKPSTRINQISKMRGSIPTGEVDLDEVQEEKIVEPQKVTSSKTQTLTERKSGSRVNIIEPENIPSIKKPIELTETKMKHKKGLTGSKEKPHNKKQGRDKEIPANSIKDNLQSEANFSSTISPEKNEALEKTGENKTKTPKEASSTQFSKSLLKLGTIPLSKSLEREGPKSTPKLELQEQNQQSSTKTNITNLSKTTSLDKYKTVTPFLDRGDAKNVLNPDTREKTKTEGAIVGQSFKASKKSNDANISNFSTSTLRDKSNDAILPPFCSTKKEDKKSSSKPEIKRGLPFEGTLPTKLLNAPMRSITNFFKPKSHDDLTPQIKFAESARTTNTSKLGGEKEEPFEGTIVRASRITDKKVTNTNSSPLMDKVNVQSEKKVASPEETKKHQTIKKQDDVITLSSKDKKTLSEIIRDRQSERSKRSKSNKDSPTKVVTGPAGLHMCTKTTVTCMEEETKAIEGEIKDNVTSLPSTKECKDNKLQVRSTETERPEKYIMYSSWLRRFKKQHDDDSAV